MNTPGDHLQAKPSRYPVHAVTESVQGLIERFTWIAKFLSLKKKPPLKKDGGIDWNTHCVVVHKALFDKPELIDSMFPLMIHRLSNRRASVHEVLFYVLFDIGGGAGIYYTLLIESMEQAKEDVWNVSTRWMQLTQIAIQYFEQFILTGVFNLIDKWNNWNNIEQTLLNSHDVMMDIWKSDRANEFLANLFPDNNGFPLDHGENKLKMCPFTGEQGEPHKKDRVGKSYEGCLLLSGKGIKGKTALDDFIILCALVVYRYEQWRKTN